MDSEGCFTLSTGARMPAIGFGTWLAAEGGEVKRAVKFALECGYKSIDCAHLYGTEKDVGEALSEAMEAGLTREKLFVTSKLWCTTSTAKRVKQACDRSLTNLHLDYLDLFLLHWPLMSTVTDPTDPPNTPTHDHRRQLGSPSATGGVAAAGEGEGGGAAGGGAALPLLHSYVREVWRGMEALVHEGRVRAIGVSNFSESQIEEILSFATVPPAVNQVELHPLWRQDQLLSFCRSHGIHVSAHTPLGTPASAPDVVSSPLSRSGEGAHPSSLPLSLSPSPPAVPWWEAPPPPGKGKSRSVHGPMLRHTDVREVAKKRGKTCAQVILRWALQRGVSVLPVSSRPEHIRSNIDVLTWQLDDVDCMIISNLEPQLKLIDDSHSYVVVPTSSGGSLVGLIAEEEGEGEDVVGEAERGSS